MSYILIGALFAIGWNLVKIVFHIIGDLLFSRLHKAKWYNVAAGNHIKYESNESHKEINKIGF